MKTGVDAAETASKRVVQKTVEATGDLIGNKMLESMAFYHSQESLEINKITN